MARAAEMVGVAVVPPPLSLSPDATFGRDQHVWVLAGGLAHHRLGIPERVGRGSVDVCRVDVTYAELDGVSYEGDRFFASERSGCREAHGSQPDPRHISARKPPFIGALGRAHVLR